MSARNVKLNVILAIALVLGLLFAAAPGKAMAAVTALVSNEADLRAALVDAGVSEITITASIGGITAPIVVNRAVTINGGGFTLTFTGLEGMPTNVDDGLTIQAPATVNNLVVNAGLSDPTAWVGTYAIHVYRTSATLNNVTATGANGGILVNGSAVTLTGAINVSGNGFGGIESSKGDGVTETPALNVTGATITNSTEAFAKPTVWEDNVTGTVTANTGQFTTNITINSSQVQYYLVPTHANPTVIFVNNAWSSVAAGADPDGAGPAQAFGFDAFVTIQAAVDAADAGDTINVAAGTYNETAPLRLNKANLTVESLDGADETIIDLQGTGLFNGVEVFKDLGDVTLDGFTVKDFTQDGIKQSYTQKEGTAFHVLNNVVTPAADYLRNGIEVTGDGSTVVGNVVNGKPLTPDWGSCGIQVDDASNVVVSNNLIDGGTLTIDVGICIAAWDFNINNVIIQDNRVTDSNIAVGLMTGIYTPQSISNISILENYFENSEIGVSATSSEYGGSTQTLTLSGLLKIEENQFIGLVNKDISVADNVTKSDTLVIDASPNWFGTILGPGFGKVFGISEYSPWCGDATCSFLTTKNADDQLELAGNITSSPILVDQDGTKILLKTGTSIENSSPCFNITASNVTIEAETKLGATCVVNGGSNGINVDVGLTDVRIIGLEFKPSDPAPATGNGIHFAGVVDGTLLIDNYIHNLPGDGIFFGAEPTGTVDIHGNLFKDNGGFGIDAGTFTVPAEYNSWGNVAGAAAPAGDGISSGVDATPFTHVDLYMVSSGTPWTDQVMANGTIKYTVRGHLVNVQSLDFSLLYPTALTNSVVTAVGPFATSAVMTSTTGKVNMVSYVNGTPVTGDVALFEVTFTAPTAGTNQLNLDETTDGFGFANTGSSTNIYAYALTDGSVKVIVPPSLTSIDLVGYYLTGVSQQLHVTLINPSDGGTFSNVLLRYTVPNAVLADIASFEYLAAPDVWSPMPISQVGPDVVGYYGPETGFPIGAGYTATSTFRITFNTPKSYPVSMRLVDLGTAPEAVLATLNQTAVVYAPPTLSSTNLSGPYLSGVEKEFNVRLQNPIGGISTNVLATFTLFGAVPADISSIFYYEPQDSTWKTLPLFVVGSNLVGYFGPGTGFPMGMPYDSTSYFKVTYAGNTTKTFNYEVKLFDVNADPDRPLTSLSGTSAVFANFMVQGTVSMQGRTVRSGVEMILTGPAIFGYGPFSTLSINVLDLNLGFLNVADAIYTITTNQPRYLNVTADLAKTINVAIDQVIAPLELKGGNADWSDNLIDVDDASEVGTGYGSTEDIDADVNFSGKVDIFDLALVGGNFDLTSAVAYAAWAP